MTQDATKRNLSPTRKRAFTRSAGVGLLEPADAQFDRRLRETIDLNGGRMRVCGTCKTSVVSADTVLVFEQASDVCPQNTVAVPWLRSIY